jgi:hypothetical protein
MEVAVIFYNFILIIPGSVVYLEICNSINFM